jgi:DNA modification methylase
MRKNYLYCGDNLEVLRRHIDTESVDLVYIDPPFNSKRNYNIFFDDKDIQTQRIAFEDTWSYKNIQDSLAELKTIPTYKVCESRVERSRSAASCKMVLWKINLSNSSC